MIETPPNRLEELRKAAGLERRDLAVALDVTEDTVRRLEKPEELIPSKYIAPLMQLLGVTSDRLLGLDCVPAAGKAA
jgi:transcriptional regulator with XRE-family HTH domain